MKILRKDYSEEVQDIVDRMPTRWCFWVTGIMMAIVSLIQTSSWLLTKTYFYLYLLFKKTCENLVES